MKRESSFDWYSKISTTTTCCRCGKRKHPITSTRSLAVWVRNRLLSSMQYHSLKCLSLFLLRLLLLVRSHCTLLRWAYRRLQLLYGISMLPTSASEVHHTKFAPELSYLGSQHKCPPLLRRTGAQTPHRAEVT